MKKFALVGSLACLLPLLAVVASGSDDAPETNGRLVAQVEPAAPAATTPAPGARPPRREPRGRLPNYYRQVGVSEAQREQIYGIQSKYQEQIAALQRQMRDVVSKRDQEIETILTPEQRAELKKLEEEAARRRAEAGEERRRRQEAPAEGTSEPARP